MIVILTVAPLVGAQNVPNTVPQVGAFYYVWYDPNQTVSWEYPKIQDKPVLGYYNSCDPVVIEQHFAWLSDLHMDFIAVSWWGMYNQTDWHSFLNNATMQIFQVARENVTNVKVALMVEPFNETGTYNYAEIYDWIYTNLCQQYPTVYYKIDNKPLICFFNGENMTSHGFPRDTRFTVKIVGNDPTAEWIYEGATNKYAPAEPLLRDRQVSVEPRFDDFYVRTPNETVDSKLEYLYAQQWERALKLANNNAVDFVTITSWNEFPERTAIEPHKDATASSPDEYFLYRMTQSYIAQLKSIEVLVPSMPWWQEPKMIIAVIVVVAVCVLIVAKMMGD